MQQMEARAGGGVEVEKVDDVMGGVLQPVVSR